MTREVVITGLGAVTAHGMTVDRLWSEVLAGNSAIRPLEPPYDSTRIKTGAMVPDYEATDHFAADELGILDRASQFAILAAKAAIDDAQLSSHDISSSACIIGSGCGGKETDEITYSKLYKDGASRAHPLTIPRGMPSAATSMVSTHLGIQGPAFMVSSACASGAHALIQGAMMIQAGLADTAIVGATDAPFTYGLMKSWDALRVVSKDTCRPFSKDRSGIVLGEGAAVIVLESSEHASRRNQSPYATVAGYSMTADAGHITRPDGSMIVKTMKTALESSKISPQQVGYINAHGTGTIANDATEASAIREVFGNDIPPLVSSSKASHGHALGAASAIELVITTLAAKNSIAPPSTMLGDIDDDCHLNLVAKHAQKFEHRYCMCNSFAFGGLNACIALS